MLSLLFVVVGIYFHSFSHALPICQYAGFCMKDSDCYPGNYCSLKLPYHSQCLPKTSSYKTSKCLENYYVKTACKSDSDCCDPGAYCNSDTFRQCQQPEFGSPRCSFPSDFPKPSMKPSKTPSLAPSINPNAVQPVVTSVGAGTNPYPTIRTTVAPTLKPVVDATITPTLSPSTHADLLKSIADEFVAYVKTFNIDVSQPGSYQKLLQVFTGNKLYFEQINALDLPFKLGVNQFSHFTNEDFRQLNIRGGKNFSQIATEFGFSSQMSTHKSLDSKMNSDSKIIKVAEIASIPATLASPVKEAEDVVIPDMYVPASENVPASESNLKPLEKPATVVSDNTKLTSSINDMHLTAAVTYGDGCKSGNSQYYCTAGNYCKSLSCYTCPPGSYCNDGIYAYYCAFNLAIGTSSCASPVKMLGDGCQSGGKQYGCYNYPGNYCSSLSCYSAPAGAYSPDYIYAYYCATATSIGSSSCSAPAIVKGDGCTSGGNQYNAAPGSYCQGLVAYTCPSGAYCPNGIYAYSCVYATSTGLSTCQYPVPTAQPSSAPTSSLHVDWTSSTLPYPGYTGRRGPYMNAVQNQGNCGSCWSFSSTGILESAYYLKYGTLYKLSEQYLVSCASSPAGQGCNGGWEYNVAPWVSNAGGMPLSSTYPYTSGSSAVTGSCQIGKTKIPFTITDNTVGGTSSGMTEAQSIAGIKTALRTSPVTIAVYASSSAFQSYKSGVLTKAQCGGTGINHAVQAVGWGIENGIEFFVIKNSWANTWGAAGFIKIATDACFVSTRWSYPTVK